MNTKLYIPKKLKVGFQKRSDTFLGTLAYVTYLDDKGVHRKQTSWESWRDKKIDPIDLDNSPHSGFTLNRDIHRGGYEWFSVGRNHIRIHDDRGVEFEITPENLIFILMNTNCVKRSLEGEFVYSWDGKDLVLLPVNCQEYKAAVGFTELQGKKVSARDIKPGFWYTTKKQERLLYLGKYDFYSYKEVKVGEKTFKGSYHYHDRVESAYNYHRKPQKKHVFFNPKKKILEILSGVEKISTIASDEQESKFPEILDAFFNSQYSGKIESLKIVDSSPDFSKWEALDGVKLDYNSNLEEFPIYYQWEKLGGSANNPEKYRRKVYAPKYDTKYDRETKEANYELKGFYLIDRDSEISQLELGIKDGELVSSRSSYYSRYSSNYNNKIISIEEMKKMKFNELVAVTENSHSFVVNGANIPELDRYWTAKFNFDL